MTELGKSAKKMGHQHPRVLRKQEPVPVRATPKKVTRPKAAKPFGFEYEHRPMQWKTEGRYTVSDGFGDWEWKRYYGRYETAKQRDQAMAAWRNQHRGFRADIYRDVRPIDVLTS